MTASPGRLRSSWGEHWPFLVALLVGALARLVVQVAFRPALIHSDGPTYLRVIDDLRPAPDRPVGYVLMLLWPLSRLTYDVLLVAVVQHLLGLVMAAVLYALMRRWGVGRWLATLATLPVLLDTMQLNLEHTVLSDTLFELLVVCGLAVLCWRRRVRAGAAVASGLVLGLAVTVRVVGEGLVVPAVLVALLLADPGWRRRLLTVVALVVAFAVPVTGYLAWYHHERGLYALSEFTGKALYIRSTTFVDCTRFSVPAYQRVLCPVEPVGQRRDPTYYVFHDTRTLPRLELPPGVTQDQALREFASAAVRAQPADYAGTVARDFLLNFGGSRVDRFDYDTAHKWNFERYLTVQPTPWTRPAYDAHGGRQLHVDQPWADVVVSYGRFGYLPGPLLAACLVLGLVGGLAGGWGVGRGRRWGMRVVTLVLALSGAGLLLVPDMTAEFTWRYQLPGLALLPAAAALGLTLLLRGSPGTADPDRTDGGPAERSGSAQAAGTVATASTD